MFKYIIKRIFINKMETRVTRQVTGYKAVVNGVSIYTETLTQLFKVIQNV